MTLTTQILDALLKAPKTTPELAQETGIEGRYLSNTIRQLLRTSKISRVEISKGRWKYYHGQTAPEWTGYDPKPKEPPKPKHRIPVKTIDVSKSYFADAVPIRITLPCPPWEISA